MKHIAIMNYVLFGPVSGIKPAIDPTSIAALATKDQIVAALHDSFVYAHAAMATVTLANETQPAPGPGKPTKISLAVFALAHSADHYGHLVEYLRMNGFTPGGGLQ